MASHLVSLGSFRKLRKVRFHGNSKRAEGKATRVYRVIRSRASGDGRTVVRSLRTGRVYSFAHSVRVFPASA